MEKYADFVQLCILLRNCEFYQLYWLAFFFFKFIANPEQRGSGSDMKFFRILIRIRPKVSDLTGSGFDPDTQHCDDLDPGPDEQNLESGSGLGT